MPFNVRGKGLRPSPGCFLPAIVGPPYMPENAGDGAAGKYRKRGCEMAYRLHFPSEEPPRDYGLPATPAAPPGVNMRNLISILMESPLYLDLPLRERVRLLKYLDGRYHDVFEE